MVVKLEKLIKDDLKTVLGKLSRYTEKSLNLENGESYSEVLERDKVDPEKLAKCVAWNSALPEDQKPDLEKALSPEIFPYLLENKLEIPGEDIGNVKDYRTALIESGLLETAPRHTREELEDYLWMLSDNGLYAPTIKEIEESEGPSIHIYKEEFGSLYKAIDESGLLPHEGRDKERERKKEIIISILNGFKESRSISEITGLSWNNYVKSKLKELAEEGILNRKRGGKDYVYDINYEKVLERDEIYKEIKGGFARIIDNLESIKAENIHSVFPEGDEKLIDQILYDLVEKPKKEKRNLFYKRSVDGVEKVGAKMKKKVRKHIINKLIPMYAYLDDVEMPYSFADVFYSKLGHAPWKQRRVTAWSKGSARFGKFNPNFTTRLMNLKEKESEGPEFYSNIIFKLSEELNAIDGEGPKNHLEDFAKVLPRDVTKWLSERDVLDVKFKSMNREAREEGYNNFIEIIDESVEKAKEIFPVDEEIVDDISRTL